MLTEFTVPPSSPLSPPDKWERHRQIDRYGRDLLSLLSSTVFRRVLMPVLNLTYLAAAICTYNLVLRAPLGAALGRGALPPLALHIAPFTLLAPVIGLLLIYRTNSSYARFAEGRLLWGAAVRHARDLARVGATYLPLGTARDHFLGYITAWAFILKVCISRYTRLSGLLQLAAIG